jgi:hypothetical protein
MVPNKQKPELGALGSVNVHLRGASAMGPFMGSRCLAFPGGKMYSGRTSRRPLRSALCVE